VPCPRAADVDSVCFMPGRTPSRGMGAALFSGRGSQKWLNRQITFQSDWQCDLIAKTDLTYTGFWGVLELVEEDHSDYKSKKRATWKGKKVWMQRGCLLDRGPSFLATKAMPSTGFKCTC
jgi:hypothetical protein